MKSFISSQKKKFLFLCLLLSLLFAFFYFDLRSYIQFEFLLQEKERLLSFYHSHPVLFGLGYIAFYIFYTTFSFPGAVLLTLMAGFIFQFFLGSLIVIIGSVTGAVFSFLISRYFLKDFLQNRFQSQFLVINEGFKKEGFFYLLSLRLIPAVPFFMINIFMGITSISTRHYILGTFLGMLPAIFVYVNAGQQISTLKSPADILSFLVVLSLLLLALLPWALKFLINLFKPNRS